MIEIIAIIFFIYYVFYNIYWYKLVKPNFENKIIFLTGGSSGIGE